MTKGMAWYKRNPQDFIDGTVGLTLEQLAIYDRCLDLLYRSGCLPNDPSVIAAGIAKCGIRTVKRVIGELVALGKLYIDEDCIWNERAVYELAAQQELSSKRASAGRLGGSGRAASGKKSKPQNDVGKAIASARSTQIREEKNRSKEDCRPPSPKPPTRIRKGQVVEGDLFPTMPGEKPPPAPDDVQRALEVYREAAKRVPMWADVRKFSSARRSALASRLKDAGGLEGWKAAILRAEQSNFLCGETKDAFRLDLDFLCQEKSFVRLIEGKYDNRPPRQFQEVSSNGRHQDDGRSQGGFERYSPDREGASDGAAINSDLDRLLRRQGLEGDRERAAAVYAALGRQELG